MSLHKAPTTALLLLCASAVLHAQVCAQSSFGSSVSNTPPGLTVKLRSEEPLGSGQVQRAYATFGTNQFAFVVPPYMRMDASNPHKIIMSKPDLSCFITFRLVDPTSTGLAEPDAEKCRNILQKRYSDLKITDEFSLTADGHAGPAFEIQWTNAGGAAQAGRIAFIPSTAGLLEFSLECNADQLDVGKYWLSWVMTTFSSNEEGKLRIARFSNSF